MKKRTINGVELAFVDQGNGPPVVLVHGFPLDHGMWNAQINALLKAHRVIAVDLRGFGQSEVTAGKVTMEQFADDLAALLDVLGIDEPITLAGLSMGGYVAFAFHHKYASRVRGLVLCDTRAVADTAEVAAGRLAMAERVEREGPAVLVDTMMPRLFAEATVRQRPELVESLRRVMLGSDPRAVAAASRGMAERPDVTAGLGQIRCPTLVIVGRHDDISPVDEMRAIAEAIPDAHLVEILDSGHMTTLEQPNEVNRAMLEFLAGLAVC